MTAVTSQSEPSSRDTALAGLLRDLYTRALFLTGSHASADDLVQDVCERALRSAEALDRPARPRAWFHAVLRNAFIDGQRRGARWVYEEPEVVAPGCQQGDEVDPLERVSEEELATALARLTGLDRKLVQMAYVTRLSYREMGAALSLGTSTIGTRLYRARRKLRRLLIELQRASFVHP